MGIYIGLLIFVLALPHLVAPFCKNEEQKNIVVARIGMLVIFLLLALKGDVGSDISEYLMQYKISASRPWNDTEYVYFETGYVMLMKVFSKAGIDFQWFLAFIYALACSSMYLFIKKYSKNASLSLIIFICYQFLVFYISGLRQTVAMSLCLFAFLIFQKRKLLYYIAAFLLNYLAFTMHQSSVVFFLALVLALFKQSKTIPFFTYVAVLAASIVARPFIWNLADTLFQKNVEGVENMTLGGNFLIAIGIAVLMYFVNSRQNILRLDMRCLPLEEKYADITLFASRMALTYVCALALFAGHSMTRSAMYFSLFLIVGLPNTVRKFAPRYRFLTECALVFFFVALFYLQTLVPNQLELCPYKFFWE